MIQGIPILSTANGVNIHSGEFANSYLFNDPNLVAYYKLEDLTDSKGSNTLTNLNSSSFVSAKFNNGLSTLKSPINYLYRATDLGIAGNSDATMCGWFKNAHTITSGEIYYIFLRLTSTVGTARTFQIYYAYNSAPSHKVVLYNGGGQQVIYTLDMSTFWYHLAAVRTVGSNKGELFINGVSVGTCSMGVDTVTSAFSLGGDFDDGSGYTSISTIDDVAIFNRALTATEILSIYNGKG